MIGIDEALYKACEDNRKLEDEIEEKDKEIERLKAREQECIDKYLAESKYRGEVEGKYVHAKYVIDELEKWLEEHSIIDYECNATIVHEQMAIATALSKLKALKEGK